MPYLIIIKCTETLVCIFLERIFDPLPQVDCVSKDPGCVTIRTAVFSPASGSNMSPSTSVGVSAYKRSATVTISKTSTSLRVLRFSHSESCTNHPVCDPVRVPHVLATLGIRKELGILLLQHWTPHCALDVNGAPSSCNAVLLWSPC